MNKFAAILIGTSAGGVPALQDFFRLLSADISTPIIVTQHMPPTADIDLRLVFGATRRSDFVEAVDKMKLEPRKVYFAPPDYHLMIEADGSLSLSQDDPVKFARPSIDVMFESAAISLGSRACGILLTGANNDGAEGLKSISRVGGYTLVQDPNDAEVGIMPQAALDIFKPNFVGSLSAIANHLQHVQVSRVSV